MAGDRVNNYSQVDSNILELQLTTDKTFKGYHQLTLTNYDNTTVPAIAAGSAIECNGALYKFDTEEAISTTDPVTSATVADGTVYVCIVPGATTCTAAFTATAPTWSDSKQGWYGTGGQANYRYAEYLITKATASYGKGFWNKLKSVITIHKNVLQTISSSSLTKITWGEAEIDTKSELSDDSIVVKNSGYYIISGVIFLERISATADYILSLYKNGSSYSKIYDGHVNYNMPFSLILDMKAGDYIEFYMETLTDTDYDVTMVSRFSMVEL
jgi:hypothetical protein